MINQHLNPISLLVRLRLYASCSPRFHSLQLLYHVSTIYQALSTLALSLLVSAYGDGLSVRWDLESSDQSSRSLDEELSLWGAHDDRWDWTQLPCHHWVHSLVPMTHCHMNHACYLSASRWQMDLLGASSGSVRVAWTLFFYERYRLAGVWGSWQCQVHLLFDLPDGRVSCLSCKRQTSLDVDVWTNSRCQLGWCVYGELRTRTSFQSKIEQRYFQSSRRWLRWYSHQWYEGYRRGLQYRRANPTWCRLISHRSQCHYASLLVVWKTRQGHAWESTRHVTW